jgi:hypothetical protein
VEPHVCLPSEALLVKLRWKLHAADALVVALAGSGVFALALGRWLFVSLACAQLGQQTCFFDGALKATHRCFERFVFADFDNHVS